MKYLHRWHEGEVYGQGLNVGWVRGPLLCLFFKDDDGNGLKIRWRWRWKFWLHKPSMLFNWAIQCGDCERPSRPHKLVVPGQTGRGILS